MLFIDLRSINAFLFFLRWLLDFEFTDIFHADFIESIWAFFLGLLLKLLNFVLEFLNFIIKFDYFFNILIFFFLEFSIEMHDLLIHFLLVVQHVLDYQGKTVSLQFHMI